ncbi:hypothetical protein FGADI_2733 [Fusarium gaditjirri]|uniref:Zn(2)-C6 fungal-type domain-containing protein n=1 Tax=Fusarium gaditjirri TaxID=282569 RepID=A0A8H4X1S3_9HYPO|nr:hypothetical protein FGADI_2733 [Fusarium gaditjirri]
MDNLAWNNQAKTTASEWHCVPYFINFPVPDSNGKDVPPQHNVLHEQVRDISINDIRGRESDFVLDTHGFELDHHEPSLTNEEFESDNIVRERYYPEIVDFISKKLGASRVVPFEHTASFGPLRDFPLALVDFATFDLARDGEPTDLVFPHYVGESLNLYHHPAHRWYYYSDQMRDQVWVFKCHDSRTDVARGRSRRKKCDECYPICGTCSSRRVACSWRNSNKRRSQKLGVQAAETSVTLQPNDSSNCDTSGPGTPESSVDEMILRNGCQLSSTVQYQALIGKKGAFSECFQGLPSCSMTGLLEVFDQATSRLDRGQEFSMLAEGFEALANSRSMLHAWLACSSIIISQLQPSWRIHALQQHSDALKQLRLNTKSESSLTQDYNIATVLLLHVFERFENSTTESLTYLSVMAPLCLALDQPPQNTPQALVLETLVYHVAINSVFRPSYLRSYHDLSKIIKLWSKSPVLKSDASSSGFVKAGLSAWLPIEFFDILFKVSHLLHHRLTVAPDCIHSRLQELRRRMHECQVRLGNIEQIEPTATATNQELSSTNRDIESFHMRRVYSIAIELLIAKLEKPILRAEDPLVVSLCETALHHLARVRYDFTSLLWAIAVLGTGMTTAKSQDLITLHVEAMKHFAGGRTVRSVVEFLSCAWRPRPLDQPVLADAADGGNTCSLGLDILFEQSLLRTVIL